LVQELGPSFEEEKSEKVQEEEKKKEEKEENGKQQLLLEGAKESSTCLEGDSRFVVGAYWALHFWVRSCTRNTKEPIFS
jgi:hypothetical protein